jgi:hypothetical protein
MNLTKMVPFSTKSEAVVKATAVQGRSIAPDTFAILFHA